MMGAASAIIYEV